jgi:hypothetical protein
MPEVRRRGFGDLVGSAISTIYAPQANGGGLIAQMMRKGATATASVSDRSASYQQSTITLDGLGFNNEVAWTVPASRRLMRIDVHVELNGFVGGGDPAPKCWVQVSDTDNPVGSGVGEYDASLGLGASAWIVSPAGAPITVSVNCPDQPGITGVVTLHASPAA